MSVALAEEHLAVIPKWGNVPLFKPVIMESHEHRPISEYKHANTASSIRITHYEHTQNTPAHQIKHFISIIKVLLFKSFVSEVKQNKDRIHHVQCFNHMAAVDALTSPYGMLTLAV